MKLSEFKESLSRALKETPAMANDAPEDSIYPTPSVQDDPVPEVHADEEMNTCTLECELFRQVLEYCGANSAMADNIVQQAKLLGKSIGVLTVDNFDDLVGAAEYETPASSPDITHGATISAAPVVVANKYNESKKKNVKESIKDETTEKFEVVETEEEESEEDN